jgi:hypothetical protein
MELQFCSGKGWLAEGSSLASLKGSLRGSNPNRSIMKKKIKGKINFSFELRLPRELKTIKLSFQKIWSEMKEHLPFTLWTSRKS